MNTISISKKDNYAILQLDRGRGNAINLEMMKELMQAWQQLAEDESVNGVILTGKAPIFTVGLDVKELMSLNQQGTDVFFKTFGQLVFDMVRFPKPLIAAVNGHSPAGGCVFALTCDYRVMSAGPFHIGLNEVPVGIMVTSFIYELYAFAIGRRQAYQNFLAGKLCTPEEAKTQGLVDEVVPIEQVLEAAEIQLKKYLQLDQTTFKGVKHNLKMPLIKTIEEQSKWEDIVDPNEHFWKPSTRETIMKVIMSLQKKK